jgi:deoxyribonuclease V
VGGVDLSYRPPDIAVAAFALVDVTSGELIWSKTITRKVEFPYIPGFLSYRELPILLDLLNEVQDQDKLPQILLVDGNGILHQRGAGIASHLGVLADLVTVGVGKRLLCGSVNVSQMQGRETRPIVYHERTVGMAFKWKTQSKPLYVSPGHRIDVDGAMRLVNLLSLYHKLPEPIYYADSLSREAAQLTMSTNDLTSRIAPIRVDRMPTPPTTYSFTVSSALFIPT